MPVRVAHLSSTHRIPNVRVFFKECLSLAQLEYEVHFIAPINAEDFPAGPVHLVPVTSPSNRLFRMLLGAARVWRKGLQVQADIYHVHSPELLPLALLARLTGRKVVYDAHEDLPDQIMSKPWIPHALRKPVATLSAMFLHFATSWLDGVVAATPTIAEDFPSNKTVTVRNFPLDEQTVTDQGDFRQRKLQIVYVGGLSESRGLTQLVDAMAIVGPTTGVRLLLAGWFMPESYEASLRARPGWQWVDYVGSLNREEMNKCLRSSRLGVVTLLPTPNHVRSEPNKLFEYMQAGLPVLVSDFEYWKQFVTDSGTGRMVAPDSPEAIAREIEWFLDHPEESAEMGRIGRQLTTSDFSWKSQAERLHRFYMDLILRNPR